MLARFALLALASCLLLPAETFADAKLASLFTDHMVLQRDKKVPVWGEASPGEQVQVKFAGQTKAAKADEHGRWSIELDPLSAGGPHVLEVQAANALRCEDVLVGEVWLCSGQSNMAMTVNRCLNAEDEIESAKFPRIRLATVARSPMPTPQSTCQVSWQPCNPQNVGTFSATAFFFGRSLAGQLDVPIGLINSSVGGTPIQSWTSVAAQEKVDELKPLLAGLETAKKNWDPQQADQTYQQALARWKARVAKAKAAGQTVAGRAPRPQADPNIATGSPGRLYNGMIAPLEPYAIRGAIWYQGEGNAGTIASAKLYGTQLRTLISNWRGEWHEGDFPFLFVQLPNFRAPQTEPVQNESWPISREQMLKTLAVPNTGMAVTIDVGEAEDIHPRDKQTVGKRLADWALAKVYDKQVAASGPLYKSSRRNGSEIVVSFDYVDRGLVAKGGKLEGFAIAGEDRKFVWANARIDGKHVVVSSDSVASPESVRYAWADNPRATLYNAAGLPASPFRTDDWPIDDSAR